jgi:tetratricopeptide (TPR) repeat protein
MCETGDYMPSPLIALNKMALSTCILYTSVLSNSLMAAPTQAKVEKDDDKEIRQACHSHFYLLAALEEQNNRRRLNLLDKVINTNPKLPRAFYNRGFLYIDSGDLRQAEADFKKAIQLKDDYIYAHYNLACVYSLQSRHEEALSYLEKALVRGYLKFDKIPTDPDFQGMKNNPALPKMIAKYKTLAANSKLGTSQKYQTSSPDEQRQLIDEMIRKPDKANQNVALWAMQEPAYDLRVLALHLLRKLDTPESKLALLRGLYDTNGYVNKAAANALVTYGKDVEALVTSTLEDKGMPAPWYAMQVLVGIKANGAVNRIVPFLSDADSKMRIMAAESLAQLGSIEAIPQIEAALKNLPKEERERGFYASSFDRALQQLKQIKEKK